MSFGNRIKAMRVANGLTRSDISKATRKSVQSVGQWETAIICSLKADTLMDLAKVLKVDPYWLYYGKGSPVPSEQMTPETKELLDIYRYLNEANKKAWVAAGRSFIESQPETLGTSAHPFFPAKQ